MQRALAAIFICDAGQRIIMAEVAENLVIATGEANDDLTLLDVLDHVLNKGVVIRGKLIISLAGVDLVYVGLDVLLTSVETAMQHFQLNPLPSSKTVKRK
jgi:gas vesicle structural protein